MRIITLDSDKKVIGVKNVLDNYALQSNEMQSDAGEYGQVQQPDGTFITPAPTITTTVEPTLEDKINFLYYKSKGVIS